MFKVSFFVDDKNLGEAFKRLTGVALNIEHAFVPNVEGRKNGKLRVSASDSTELLVNEMKKRKLTELTAGPAREIMVAMGMSPTSYSHILNQAVERGAMTKHKKPKGHAKVYRLMGSK
jgi:hypothetical protein